MVVNNEDKDGRYFRTSNFNVACFLYTNEYELVNIDRSDNPKRATFVFKDRPERELLLHQFNFALPNSPEVLVDARKFSLAIKELKDKLYQGF